MNDLQDKVIWKFVYDGKFSVKTANWPDYYKISPDPRVKLINSIWKLNLIRKTKLFTWKLIRGKFLLDEILETLELSSLRIILFLKSFERHW